MLSWNSNPLATWWEESTHWKRPWCWERLKVGGEGDDRGKDGWMASLMQWTWVWVGSRSWWWTGKPGVLQSMGLQRVRHNWATELNWSIFTAASPRVTSPLTPGHSFSSRNPVCWASWICCAIWHLRASSQPSRPSPLNPSGGYSSSFGTQGRYALFQHAFLELPHTMMPLHFLWDPVHIEP